MAKQPTSHMDGLPDGILTHMAAELFQLGLQDSRVRSKPRTRTDVMGLFQYQARRGYSAKMRQVYGAGFDLGVQLMRVRLEKLNASPSK